MIAQMCAAVCTAALAIGGHAGATYDPYSTAPVYFYGVQVGVYVDDQQPGQCQDAAIERQRWGLVIAGIPPGPWPGARCPAATFNALEWGQYWGPPPRANAYILESASLSALTSPAPVLTRQALAFHPGLLIFWR